MDRRSVGGCRKEGSLYGEAEMKCRGALYEKGWLPFTSKVVVDGRLVTGQNPQSAKVTAEQVAALI